MKALVPKKKNFPKVSVKVDVDMERVWGSVRTALHHYERSGYWILKLESVPPPSMAKPKDISKYPLHPGGALIFTVSDGRKVKLNLVKIKRGLQVYARQGDAIFAEVFDGVALDQADRFLQTCLFGEMLYDFC